MDGWRDDGKRGPMGAGTLLESGVAASRPGGTPNSTTNKPYKKHAQVSPQNPFIPSLPPKPHPLLPRGPCPWGAPSSGAVPPTSGRAPRVSPRARACGGTVAPPSPCRALGRGWERLLRLAPTCRGAAGGPAAPAGLRGSSCPAGPGGCLLPCAGTWGTGLGRARSCLWGGHGAARGVWDPCCQLYGHRAARERGTVLVWGRCCP